MCALMFTLLEAGIFVCFPDLFATSPPIFYLSWKSSLSCSWVGAYLPATLLVDEDPVMCATFRLWKRSLCAVDDLFISP